MGRYDMTTAFTGATHLAMDTTAGEKERKSLEPLLINPVERWKIMTGKMLTTTLFAMSSLATSSAASTNISSPNSPSRRRMTMVSFLRRRRSCRPS